MRLNVCTPFVALFLMACGNSAGSRDIEIPQVASGGTSSALYTRVRLRERGSLSFEPARSFQELQVTSPESTRLLAYVANRPFPSGQPTGVVDPIVLYIGTPSDPEIPRLYNFYLTVVDRAEEGAEIPLQVFTGLYGVTTLALNRPHTSYARPRDDNEVTLVAFADPGFAHVPDSFEPNDTGRDARTLRLVPVENTNLQRLAIAACTLARNDRDNYRFRVSDPGDLYFTLYYPAQPPFDLVSIKLLGPTGREASVHLVGGGVIGGIRVVTWHSRPHPGIYTAVVSGHNYLAIQYHLEVELKTDR